MDGSHVLKDGKSEIISKKTPMIMRKGITPFETSAAVALPISWSMKRFIPSGGDIKANSEVTAMITPNQRPLNFKEIMTG